MTIFIRLLTGSLLAATVGLGCASAQTVALPGGRRLPDDVAAFTARATRCATEQPASAAEGWVSHERCMTLPGEKARLLRRHARDRAIVALLRSIDTSLY